MCVLSRVHGGGDIIIYSINERILRQDWKEIEKEKRTPRNPNLRDKCRNRQFTVLVGLVWFVF